MVVAERWRVVVLWAILAAGCVDCLPTFLPGQKVQVAGPAPDLGNFTRAGCDNFTGDVWQPLRPAYHITVPYGWLNDPHGMFQLRDTVHLFFQYNPRDLAWGEGCAMTAAMALAASQQLQQAQISMLARAMDPNWCWLVGNSAPFWGHVVSKDLAHWTWLPPALLPDTPYDFNGVWSGAATMADGDLPILTYTAASTEAPEMGNFFQRQAMAVPANMSDPLLKKWVKPTTNPFLVQVPPGGTNFQFRDPTEGRHAVWQAMVSQDNARPLNRSHYALAIGSQAYCMGGAGIYTAPTMAGPWSFQGSLYNQMVPEPEIDGQCMASRSSSTVGWPGPAYGGPCDQFGAFCRMWEVVDFAELDNGVYFLKWDDQSHFRALFSMEWYVLGNGPWDYAAIHPDLARTSPPQDTRGSMFGVQYSGYPNEPDLSKVPSVAKRNQDDDYNQIDNWEKSAKRSLFTGKVDGQRFAPMRTDYGSTYASMVFRTADMRQVMFSWIYETAAGCKFMCSDEMPGAIKRQGFKGAQTLPRQLTYEPLTKTLRAYPVEETNKLRGKQVFNSTNAAIKTFPQVTPLVAVTSVPGVTGGSGGSSSSRLSASNVTARQFEVQAAFTLLPPGSSSTGNKVVTEAGQRRTGSSIVKQPDEFAFGVRIELGNGRFADAYMKGTVRSLAPQSPAYVISSLSVWFDRSQAGGDTNTTFLEGGPVPLPVNQDQAWTAPDTPLTMSVWVDHGVVEIYAMQGLARLTSRIYPNDDAVAWGTSVWAIPPEPTAGVAVDRAAAARAAEALRPPTVLTGIYCWWCRTWSGSCKDTRCYSGISRWPEPGEWGALFDGQVWEMKSAWLPPSC